ncbi:hypothetical protein FACS189430_11830 [Bacteroidia bacterium]|nr:hypothetical protein FACS189430_11830 [Bacteroidia bacterium]
MPEQQTIEYKSVLQIINGDKGFKALSTICVSLGGIFEINKNT